MRDPEKLFADAIIGWHEACGRHDLPWQVEDWYPRLVSEVMLQQTQVVSVLPKYEAFMTAFPTPECLAAAPDDDVMALWAGPRILLARPQPAQGGPDHRQRNGREMP